MAQHHYLVTFNENFKSKKASRVQDASWTFSTQAEAFLKFEKYAHKHELDCDWANGLAETISIETQYKKLKQTKESGPDPGEAEPISLMKVIAYRSDDWELEDFLTEPLGEDGIEVDEDDEFITPNDYYPSPALVEEIRAHKGLKALREKKVAIAKLQQELHNQEEEVFGDLGERMLQEKDWASYFQTGEQ
jgi:hypothetical protein